MNKFISIGMVAITSVFLMCCGSSKAPNKSSLQNNPPFKVVEATYSKQFDEQTGVNNIIIRISINNPEILLDTVYFRNNSSILILDKSDSNSAYVGSLVLPRKNQNFNLNLDSKKEYGNQAPDISRKIPFELKENEAIVSYLLKNKRTYFKISNFIEVSKK